MKQIKQPVPIHLVSGRNKFKRYHGSHKGSSSVIWGLNKIANVEDKLLLVCLKLFTNSFRTIFTINNSVTRHAEVIVHAQLF